MRREPRPSCAVQATHTMPKYLQLFILVPTSCSFISVEIITESVSISYSSGTRFLLAIHGNCILSRGMWDRVLLWECGIGCYSAGVGRSRKRKGPHEWMEARAAAVKAAAV